GILSSVAKGNPAAEAALFSRSIEGFVHLTKDKLTEIAANKPEVAPRMANEWVFSKNYQTMPFTFWATALCLFHMLGFYIICDVLKWNVPFMAVIGLNPLFIY